MLTEPTCWRCSNPIGGIHRICLADGSIVEESCTVTPPVLIMADVMVDGKLKRMAFLRGSTVCLS